MISAAVAVPARSATERPQQAKHRAARAREGLRECHFCAHHCGVNRLGGEVGRCRARVETRFFSAQVEVSDELELIPTFAVALSGCDLRCDFCITGKSSWNPNAGTALDLSSVASRAHAALADGARTVMLLGGEPTIHLPAALELVAALPASARLVWKTNGHGSAEARALLQGLFDVWLVDFKFGDDQCAHRLAGVENYLATLEENLMWAEETSELIVRHLLMPGHLECCWGPIASWLATYLPETKVSLRSGFWPAWRAGRHPGLSRTVSAQETERAWKLGRQLGLNLIE